MGRKSGGMSTGAALLLTFAILAFIGWLIGLSEPKCAVSGCDRDAIDGSKYCVMHDMSDRYYGEPDYNAVYERSQEKSRASKSTGTDSSNATNSSSSTSTKTNKASGSGKKSSSYDSYDDGYEDVYNDGDYDDDRYRNDDDYASGVDDALDEWDEEGEDW